MGKPEIPPDILSYFGDFDWPRRQNAFSNPQFSSLVPSLQSAILQLERLYPPEVCEEIVSNGAGSLVLALFAGPSILPTSEELLLLGADLAMYEGWQLRPKLLGQLCSLDGWSGARFEIGVHAGLVRAGLNPAIEPQRNKSNKAPDFVVSINGLSVAIELKTLRAPQIQENLRSLRTELANALGRLPRDWCGRITLSLHECTIAALNMQPPRFARSIIPTFRTRLLAASDELATECHVTLEDIGHFDLQRDSTEHDCSMRISYTIEPDMTDREHLLRRAIRCAKEAAAQLGTVPADLRLAVLWTGRSSLPAGQTAMELEARIGTEEEHWTGVSLDWIVLFNAHAYGEHGRWNIDLALCRVSSTAKDVPAELLDALTRWGPGRMT